MGLTIGEFARRTVATVQTIRYHERIGPLPAPGRTAANRRAHDASHLGRLSFIRRGRDLGFSLDDMRKPPGLADRRDLSRAAVDVIAGRHLAETQRKIADLAALRDELSDLIGRCRRHAVADCRIIETPAPRD